MKRFTTALMSCLLAASALHAEDRYLVVFFAMEDGGGSPSRAHTFATFLKVDVAEPDEDGVVTTETVEAATISWLPASGNIRLLARPESGRNYDLAETLKWAKERGLETTARGPFEIGSDLYERALKQKRWLESGAVAYKAIDWRFRPGGAVNCIHAVSDLIPGPLLETGAQRGGTATALVAGHFRPHLVDAKRAHAWALRHLDFNGTRVTVQNDPETQTVKKPIFVE